jgi:hypothetical protein
MASKGTASHNSSHSGSHSAAHTEPHETDLAAGSSGMADLTRQQLANTASTTGALLRAMDSFQQTQQHMIQRAALLQERTADRLRSATSPIELVAIQSTVVLSSLSEWAQYSQELMLASLKAQSEFMRPAELQQQSAAQAANAAGPLFQAWQSVFSAPMSGAMAGVARHH